MRVIDNLDNYGEIITVPVKSRCNDGRKVPNEIDLDMFMQLNAFEWLERLPYQEMIFTYNPFRVFPITVRSITDTVDPEKKRYDKKHRKKSYYLPRVFENTGRALDPVYSDGANNIVVFSNDIPDGELFFQVNHPGLYISEAGLVVITKHDFERYHRLVREHQTYFGELEQKIRF